MKNIAFMVDDLSCAGGTQRVTATLAKELRKYYNIYVITLYGYNNFFEIDKNIRIYNLNNKFVRLRYSLVENLFDLRKYIKNNNVEVLIVIGRNNTFLPLLLTKPWSMRTFILLGMTIFVMNTFQSTISTFVEVADQAGKNIPMEEVFDGNRMNIFRVAVYSVVPITALLFKQKINQDIDRQYSLFIQMNIVCLLFMMMGMMDGANMFGRAGNYFEIGMICSLPWIVRQLFTKQSVTIVLTTAVLCFSCFYLYDNNGFEYNYSRKGIVQFIGEII